MGSVAVKRITLTSKKNWWMGARSTQYGLEPNQTNGYI